MSLVLQEINGISNQEKAKKREIKEKNKKGWATLRDWQNEWREIVDWEGEGNVRDVSEDDWKECCEGRSEVWGD